MFVEFGASGQFKYIEATNSAPCNTTAFAGDPAFLQVKSCFTLKSTGSWTLCAASEGSKCPVTSSSIVRFGQNGKYLYIKATNSVICSTGTFGGDPTGSAGKSCWIKALS